MSEVDLSRVLFLDIDGVLNSVQWAQDGNRGFGCPPRKDFIPTAESLKWCPAAVRNLRDVIESTGAKIVVSSSWRGYGAKAVEVWQRMFAVYGWPDAPVIGETPHIHDLRGSVPRGEEVHAWLVAHPEVTQFVCLDDDSDFLDEQPLVQTDVRFGLTMLEAKKCKELLT